MRSSLLTVLAVLASLVGFSGAARAQVVAYHDQSSAAHQTQFNTLSAQGYRLVSLSVAGTTTSPRYSAVWDQTSGPPWVAAHDMTPTQYATTRATWESQGYRAKLVTMTGTSSNRIVAAVYVQDGKGVVHDVNYSESSLASAAAQAHDDGYVLVSVDPWEGVGGIPLYCAVFEEDTTGIVWGYDIDETPADFDTTKLAHAEGGERLAALGISDAMRYVSVWHDQRVGTETIAHHQTLFGWPSVVNTATAASLKPRVIASAGSGLNMRLAGSFAYFTQPLPRQQSTTGVYRSQFAAFDTYMRDLLIANRARAGALAIARDGKLVYARAFTRAEAGYPITQPTDVFRIGSCTKPITAIATHRLVEMGLASLSTKPQSVLGLAVPAGSDFDEIELRHVLEYTSGVQKAYDPVTVAMWPSQPNPLLPATITWATHWLAAQPLLFSPSNPSVYSHYSNAAFILPAEVIRVRSGLPFMTFVQQQVFNPLGINRIRVAPSEFAQLTADDVIPHLSILDLDPSELYTDRRRRSAQYAEDLNFKRASGGLAGSAVDYVRFLSGVFDLRGPDALVLAPTTLPGVLDRHTFTKWSEPAETEGLCLAAMGWDPRPNGVYAYRKGGSLENASCTVSWRTDGVSFAAFVNKGGAGDASSDLHTLVEAVTSWPNVDEFPSYGLPAFPRRPVLTTALPTSLANVTQSHFLLAGERLDTVTQVQFGPHVITSTSPADWEDGYFTVLTPNAIQLHPPQGLVQGSYAVTASNAAGAGAGINVSLTTASTFSLGAPTVVRPGQGWGVYVARGTGSGLSLLSGFCMLAVSFSNQPSSAPGIVDLGLGAQFSDLVLSDVFSFSLLSGARRIALPPLPSGTVYLEAIGFDVAAPSIFPLLTTATRAVTRL